MKVLVDIKDSKSDFILELLNSFPFVKTKRISPAKAKFLLELKGALDEVKLAKRGKVKLKPAHDLVDEL